MKRKAAWAVLIVIGLGIFGLLLRALFAADNPMACLALLAWLVSVLAGVWALMTLNEG